MFERIFGLMSLFLQNPLILSRKVVRDSQKYGFKVVLRKIRRMFFSKKYVSNGPSVANLETISSESFSYQPLISVVMPTYNVDPKWCSLAVQSIKSQSYPNWELCIVDDGSKNQATLDYLKSLKNEKKIKVKFLNKNVGISAATNESLKLVSGEYVAFLDHDDAFSTSALFEVAKCLNENQSDGPVDIIYSDEDLILPNGQHVNPHFKSDFNPDLLLMHNYITHLLVYKKTLIDDVGYFRSEYDGAQDYDYVLRATELAKNIKHIPKILYHWRMIETSTALNINAKPLALHRTKELLEETLKRRNIQGEIVQTILPFFFRVKRKIIANPLVSIIIPFKDSPEMLRKCLNSILEKSLYLNYEIIAINNNSLMQETFDLIKEYKNKFNHIQFIDYNEPFNFSKINNFAVGFSKGEHLVLLNNDVVIISNDWIETMLEHSQRKEVGAVGIKLYYPNETIQHAGIIIGIKRTAGHSHKGHMRPEIGYFNRLMSIQNVSAVTGACLMIKKDYYLSYSGLDEKNFAIAFNDVDFCLRLRKGGLLNVFTPFAEAYHVESASRGNDLLPINVNRYNDEKEKFQSVYQDLLIKGDPYYNVNLTLEREDFSFR